MKTASVIRHLAFEDLGSLSSSLLDAGYAVQYYEAGVSDLNEIVDQDPDLLVVLGGPIGAYDEADYPFLETELALLSQRLFWDRPTIGICLGAQLMARALGAEVYPGGEKEIGWFPLRLTEAGRYSPLASLASDEMPVLHWHGDTFGIPDNAIHLAESERYPHQAFLWGENCLALQFHPEVTRQNMERWYIGHACEISQTPGISVRQLREDTIKYADKLEHCAKRIWQDWLGQISTKTKAMGALQQ